jgi:hypothetical protein
MAKDEYCDFSRGHIFKKLHIRERLQCGDL